MDLDKLLEIGDRCINEEPPACTAHCPVHLDVKSFVEEIEKGDFKKAYKIMEKRIPFPRIIGMLCDNPCENVCVRNNKGGAIGISELEKAAVYYGYSKPKKLRPLPPSKKTIAVIGSGLRGMTAAYDLNKKGYKIDIYEKNSRLGGRLWNYINETLTKEIINEEFDFVNSNNINLYLNTNVDIKTVEEIAGKYTAVLLSSSDLVNQYKCDNLTFQAGDSNIFSAFTEGNNNSIIFAASAGRRAAISIDRYLQNVSMTASRENEGSYETVLKYKDDEEEEKKRVEKKSHIYSREEAVEEANRCFKCQCRDCINPCVHLKRFNIAPKSYIRNINHNERIIQGSHYANKMINSCTECGLCNEMCDYGVNMKEVIEKTRESMVLRGKMPQSAHDFALKDMKFSNSERFLTYKKEVNKDKVKYVFYPGCQLPASDPEYIERIYTYLTDNINEGVGLMLGCCGAPADWGGQQSLMKESADLIKNAWEELGNPIFILACFSCGSNFEKYMKEIEYISLWEIIDKNPLPETLSGKDLTLNIHDPCTSRHNDKAQESVRNILSRLNCQVRELKFSKDKTKCCGYGGLVYFANREQSEDFINDRINESPEDLLVYCTMCKDLFISHNKRTFHMLDLLFSDNLEEASMRKMPSLSDRQHNRMMVKKDLLKNIWGEDVEMDNDEKLNITLTQEVKEKMEELYILLSDINKAVMNSIETKERFFNPKDSSYLTRLRIENVTYWVKYEIIDEKITVLNVYSHRMEVVEGGNENIQ
jgi:glutamate synthase (NADPH/NADH) small chain